MNRLVIIGNGFDMAHGLKTSYKDFINWYWDQIRDHCLTSHDSVYKDRLVKISLINTKDNPHWFVFFNASTGFREYVITNENLHEEWKYSGLVIFNYLEDQGICTIEKSPLFDKISKSIETKGWVDIENDYYSILKSAIGKSNYESEVNELNKQLKYIQDKLVEYLATFTEEYYNDGILNKMIEKFNLEDFSSIDKDKALESIEASKEEAIRNNDFNPELKKLLPKQIMLLSFNYTDTISTYNNFNITSKIYIHGDLVHPQNIIFGYGDELDKDFKDIVERNENELLKNVKSVKYLETDNYRKMLNTIFEHKNCVSIKPFYYKRKDGTDNYLELVQNIYRNFTDLKLYRDRVVNKTQCLTM